MSLPCSPGRTPQSYAPSQDGRMRSLTQPLSRRRPAKPAGVMWLEATVRPVATVIHPSTLHKVFHHLVSPSSLPE